MKYNKGKGEVKMKNSTKSDSIDCFDVVGNYFDVVGIVFLILKILAIEPVAHWSWLWVLCPFWGPIVLVIIFFIFKKIL